MENPNKIQQTSVGDNINYFINGVNNNGVVVKMTGSYVTILKDNTYDIVHINDTFFVKDIIYEYKSWDDMNLAEKTELLTEHHAYSPRFLSKFWKELPSELRDVLTKDAMSDKERISNAKPKKEPKTTQGQSTNARNPEHSDGHVETPEGSSAPEDIKSENPQRSSLTTGDATYNPRSETGKTPKGGKSPEDLSKALLQKDSIDGKQSKTRLPKKQTLSELEDEKAHKEFGMGMPLNQLLAHHARDPINDNPNADLANRHDPRLIVPEGARSASLLYNEETPKGKLARGVTPITRALDKLRATTKGLVPRPDTKLEKSIKELRATTKGLVSKIYLSTDSNIPEGATVMQKKKKPNIDETKKAYKARRDFPKYGKPTKTTQEKTRAKYGTLTPTDEHVKKVKEDERIMEILGGKRKIQIGRPEEKEIGKSDVENGAYGNVGSTPEAGISTQTNFDAEKDYEGASHENFNEQFKHDEKKPKTSRDNEKKKDSGTMTSSTAGINNPTNINRKNNKEEHDE